MRLNIYVRETLFAIADCPGDGTYGRVYLQQDNAFVRTHVIRALDWPISDRSLPYRIPPWTREAFEYIVRYGFNLIEVRAEMSRDEGPLSGIEADDTLYASYREPLAGA